MLDLNTKVLREKVKNFLNNPEGVKTLIALIPSAIIFYLSYASPFVFSLGLLGQIFVPLLAIVTTGLSGFSYFSSCFKNLKNAYVNIKNQIKNAPNKLQLVRDELRKTFNMSFLVTLSCTTSVLYAVILFGAAPLVLYTSPLFFLASLNLSAFLRSNISTLSKEINQKLVELRAEKKLYETDEIRLIKSGILVEILSNSLIPVDCELIATHDGNSISIEDRTVATGELGSSKDYKIGSELSAGTRYIGEHPITVRATVDYNQSVHYKRIEAILKDSSEQNKSQFTKKIDKIISYFIPAVLVVAFGAMLIWTLLSGVNIGLHVMMNVFFAACPCTLALAANCTYAILKIKLFKNNIIIYQDDAIEQLPESKTIVFDKTGTLTTLSFKAIKHYNNYKSETDFDTVILRAVAAVQKLRLIERPTDSFAKAILDSEKFKNLEDLGIVVKENTRNGVWLSVENRQVFIGNARYLEAHNIALTDRGVSITDSDQDPKIYVGLNFAQGDAIKQEPGVLYSSISFAQTLRDDAQQTISHLMKMGHEVHMITGDTADAAYPISDTLGIPRSNVSAQCTPESKRQYVERLSNDKKSKITFVGDGWNDHEASRVDDVVSVAMGKISNMHGFFSVTIENLSDLMKLKSACKTTVNYQSKLFWFAIFTNLIAMILAAVIFPIYGIGCMMGCLGACMAGLSLVATFGASFLIPSINKAMKEEIVPKCAPRATSTISVPVEPTYAYGSAPRVTHTVAANDAGNSTVPAAVVVGGGDCDHRHHLRQG